jgi:hypothetical protein
VRVYKHIEHECRFVDEEMKRKVRDANRQTSLVCQKQALTVPTGSEFEVAVRGKGGEEHRLNVNQKVLEFLCAAGLPPHVVSYPEWDALIYSMDRRVKIYSEDSFSEKFIPAEACRVTVEAIQLLQKKRHLTISYDGGSTRAVESIYSVHVTTPETRESYFIEGNEASGLSHTGEHIRDLLLKVCLLLFKCICLVWQLRHPQVIDQIGRPRFSGICSDSTGNTRLARELVTRVIPTIIILPDICHLLNNAAKDIQKLDHFKEVSLIHFIVHYWTHLI